MDKQSKMQVTHHANSCSVKLWTKKEKQTKTEEKTTKNKTKMSCFINPYVSTNYIRKKI